MKFKVLENLVDLRRLLVISALVLWCGILIAARVHRTGSGSYVFLMWNLFLAGIPLFLSTLLRALVQVRGKKTFQLGCFALWLLFLPNAPYMLTDIQHLKTPTTAPTWYDVAVLVSCAGTGILLGYLSLVDIHGIVARKFGDAWGWMLALSCLGLAGFAIYLGRFLRWNSWDVLVDPGRFFEIAPVLTDPMSHPRALGVTFVFGTILALGYIALRVLLASASVSPVERAQGS